MKETTIQFRADQDKVNAIRICLADKNASIESELGDYIDVLYRKYVPQAVRDFIEKSEIASQTENESKRPRTKRVKRDLSEGGPGADNYPSGDN